jgi:hypothetical protein
MQALSLAKTILKQLPIGTANVARLYGEEAKWRSCLKIMFREIYYEYSRALFCGYVHTCKMCFYAVCAYARSIGFLAVKGCVKGLLRAISSHGKSPCFRRYGFSVVFGVDRETLFFSRVDGAVLHE